MAYATPNYPCDVCSKLVYVNEARLSRSVNGVAFCSQDCHFSWRKGKPTAKREGRDVSCLICKKIFFRDKEKIARGGNYYCSKECQSKKSPSQEVLCETCGKRFLREQNVLKKRKHTFCSHPCYGKWRTANLSGENSPQWKGGKSLEYGGSNWKSQRRKARKRDNFTCQDCGVKEQSHGYQLDVHHLTHYKRFKNKEAANRLSNLITVCRVCHMNRHKQVKEVTMAKKKAVKKVKKATSKKK